MASAMDFGILPSHSQDAFHPFQVAIPQEDIDQLKQLLELSPLGPKTYESSLQDRPFGVTRQWLEEAVDTWKTSFDWREHERFINSFPAFTAKIDDRVGSGIGDHNVHFVGFFSRRSDAIPLLLLHGWPGSFLEFLPILDKLRTTYSPDTLPYHLIIPSLPGYAFSSAPPLDRDFRLEDVAMILDRLMAFLGFGDGYVVQGGDVGSKVARVIAARHAACKALHINFCIMPQPKQVKGAISEAEKIGLLRAEKFSKTGSAYALEHATRPSTIGFVLGSSPVSLLAWVGEKFLDWSDDDPSLDVILEAVSLYWFANCAATSLYPYRHLFAPGVIGAHENPEWYCQKPFGFSWFPKELAPIPKAWVATTGDLVFHREHSSGGHFAALEKPDELWKDIEDFVKQVWQVRRRAPQRVTHAKLLLEDKTSKDTLVSGF